MRSKSDAIDYRYFREPNIVEMDISHLVPEAQKNMNELPSVIRNNLIHNGVADNVVNQLLDDYAAYKAFKYVNSKLNNPGVVIT
jgi:Asp-tRNA(Asn)/Glu-tRNA(Gln) amidotransferase B subunit